MGCLSKRRTETCDEILRGRPTEYFQSMGTIGRSVTCQYIKSEISAVALRTNNDHRQPRECPTENEVIESDI